jgi:hypothetical protein
MKIVCMLFIFAFTTALAQQSLKINEPVGRQLASGIILARPKMGRGCASLSQTLREPIGLRSRHPRLSR